MLSKTCRDVSRCDRHGRNALHLVASSESIHARKMVSLLLKNGSDIGEHALYINFSIVCALCVWDLKV